MRVSSAAALSAAVGLAFALPAAAAVAPSPNGCDDTGDGYSAGGVCAVKVEVASPVCVDDVPYLTYKVAVEGAASPLTITWDNPSGADVVQSGLPLEGRVPWPGAVAGADGKGVDWPGWTKASDGTWVQGDAFDWVRAGSGVAVTFAANQSVTTTVAYPPSSSACLTSPASSVLAADPASSQVLAATGSETTPWLVAAGALVLAGGGLVAARARSRRHAES
ncbi:LPXTG cell wall anchor domain-containing protein [Cellulomonas sp. NPDC055163]